MTSALEGVAGQRHAPAALYPQGKNPVPIRQEAGWATEPVTRLEEKPFRLCWGSKLDSAVVQSEDRQYEVLPKSSGNLNKAREPVVVRPSAARCAEQYPL
jgi:hypothetical protein